MSAEDPRAISARFRTERLGARTGSAFEVNKPATHPVRDLIAFAGFGLFFVWLIHLGSIHP